MFKESIDSNQLKYIIEPLQDLDSLRELTFRNASCINRETYIGMRSPEKQEKAEHDFLHNPDVLYLSIKKEDSESKGYMRLFRDSEGCGWLDNITPFTTYHVLGTKDSMKDIFNGLYVRLSSGLNGDFYAGLPDMKKQLWMENEPVYHHRFSLGKDYHIVDILK
ncbi:MAG: hypothetical protein ACQEP1_01275 [Nanobdellota archaeon]